MAVEIFLARALRVHVEAPESLLVEGATVGEAMGALARRHPRVRRFVLDDQGRVRRHVNVYVNDAMIRDREGLSDAVADGDRVHILAAVSGGRGEFGEFGGA